MRIQHPTSKVVAGLVTREYAKKVGGIATELLYSDNVGTIREVVLWHPTRRVGFVYYVPSSRSWTAIHADGTLMDVDGNFFTTNTMRYSARLLVDDYITRNKH